MGKGTWFKLATLTVMGALVAGCSEAEPLVSGRGLAGMTGEVQEVGSLPVNMIGSPDGRFAISTDAGYRQALWAIDLASGKGVSQVPFVNRQEAASATRPQEVPGHARRNFGLYYGLALAPDGTLYASQGGYDAIAVLHLDGAGQLTPRSVIATKPKDFPAGLALDRRGLLYVANQSMGTESNGVASAAIYDPATGRELGRYRFTDSPASTTNYPLAVAALPDGSRLFVASERDGAVYVLDTRDPARPTLLQRIAVGESPQALLLNRAGTRLFVSNANSDTVSVLDTAAGRVVSTILMRPAVAEDLPGCSPLGMALSPDEGRLFVALGDFNAVAVVDLAVGSVAGYIPTGWYPTAVVAAADGRHLLVADAKGARLRVPNVTTDSRSGQRRQAGSPLNLLEGVVQRLEIPTGWGLAQTTEKVLRANRLDRLTTENNPLAHLSRKSGKITHVIYVIKENRTYDQVFGDLPQGNGEAGLCLFGREVTPNQHALAERFTLLDNLYACGEVSGEGWCWSTGAIANAHVVRNVPYHYSRGRHYDYEGTNNGYTTGGLPGKPPQNPAAPRAGEAHPTVRDVAEGPGGHLWDLCNQKGVGFRNYGFFTESPPDLPGNPENYPSARGLQPAGHDLEGLTDADFRGFDLDFADSDAPEHYYRQTGDANCLFPTRTAGKHNIPSRISEFRREFSLMLQKDPTGNAVPPLLLVRLPVDHTVGVRAGAHSPRSYVADNDYAVGQLVETISRSPIWEHCAIFIIEDDAQAGPDHVDSHRTVGQVISPYMPMRVDHRFYNTNSFLRTIELLLDLPPMTQYDATATVVAGWSSTPVNAAPFTAMLPSKEIIAERSPSLAALRDDAPRRELALRSAALDFSHADSIPFQELNAILWKSIHGPEAVVPAPRQACPFFLKPDDDD